MQDERSSGGRGPRRPHTNGSHPDGMRTQPIPFTHVSDEPIDLVAVQADDELISALAAGMSVSAPGVGGYDADDQVAALLATWRAEVDREPLPELVDLDTAMAAVRSSSRPSGRRARHLFPVAAAAAMIVFTVGGVSVGAAEAKPGDTLWGVSRVLYAERAESVEAAERVEVRILEAKEALSRGEPALAAQALAAAEEDLVAVRVEEGLAELAEVQSFLEAKAAETPPGQPVEPGSPLESDPRRPVPPGAVTETPSPALAPPPPATATTTTTTSDVPAPAASPVAPTSTAVPPTSSPSTGGGTTPGGPIDEGTQDPPPSSPTAEGSPDATTTTGQGLGPSATAEGTPTASGSETSATTTTS